MSLTYHNKYFTFGKRISVGEGFTMQTVDEGLLDDHGLLGNGILHLLNGLADLTVDVDNLRSGEWSVLEGSLRSLLVGYDHGPLYSHVLHTYGAESLSPNLWIDFGEMGLMWPLCTQVFKDMPTGVLESHGDEIWRYHRGRQGEETCRKEILKALGERTDIYGAHSLPADFAFDLLFGGASHDFQ